jgi:hypothetical protein
MCMLRDFFLLGSGEVWHVEEAEEGEQETEVSWKVAGPFKVEVSIDEIILQDAVLK